MGTTDTVVTSTSAIPPPTSGTSGT
jgi:hypothetical protein